MRFPHPSVVTSVSFVAAVLGGCLSPIEQVNGTGSDGNGQTGEPTDIFDKSTMAIVSGYKAFPQINSAPYQSSLGAFDINLFVFGDSQDYSEIHPESNNATDLNLAVGTVIVREVLDDAGDVSKLTIMAKAPTGYDASLGDWWFGEADPTGHVLVTNGQLRVGRLTDCHGCHVPRVGDDYLFGVPEADEAAH